MFSTKDLHAAFLELIRLTSTDIPIEVEENLQSACDNEEEGSTARNTLEAILNNIRLARQNGIPVCQDTGTPFFFVRRPAGWGETELREMLRGAVGEATRRGWLRPNVVNTLTGVNSGDNLGDEHFPQIECRETTGDELVVDLLLKGGGCENVSSQYSLPDVSIDAGRDLNGVRKAVLHSVWQAQGQGCAPGFLGVAIGGDRASSYQAAKQFLLQPPGERNPIPELAELEQQITEDANQLGIGPMGLGGSTTLFGVHVCNLHRLPASYFVSIAYMCWAYRHRRMTLRSGEVTYA